MSELERLRAQIEQLDARLIVLVAERVRLARGCGAMKCAAGITMHDPAREAAVVRRAAVQARELGLPEEPMRDLVWSLIGLCRSAQSEDS